MICTTMSLNEITSYKFLAQRRSFSIVTTALLLSTTMGCATIVKGTNQKIPISSYPSNAEVYIDGNFAGSTPIDIQMKRKRDHLVTIEKTGYLGASVLIVKDVGGAVWGNIILGGLVGWGVDAVSGAQYNLNPSTVNVTLERISASADRLSVAPTTSKDFIQKLNELDELLDAKRVTTEEYMRLRTALFKEYYPELLPERTGDPPPTGANSS